MLDPVTWPHPGLPLLAASPRPIPVTTWFPSVPLEMAVPELSHFQSLAQCLAHSGCPPR